MGSNFACLSLSKLHLRSTFHDHKNFGGVGYDPGLAGCVAQILPPCCPPSLKSVICYFRKELTAAIFGSDGSTLAKFPSRKWLIKDDQVILLIHLVFRRNAPLLLGSPLDLNLDVSYCILI